MRRVVKILFLFPFLFIMMMRGNRFFSPPRRFFPPPPPLKASRRPKRLWLTTLLGFPADRVYCTPRSSFLSSDVGHDRRSPSGTFFLLLLALSRRECFFASRSAMERSSSRECTPPL